MISRDVRIEILNGLRKREESEKNDLNEQHHEERMIGLLRPTRFSLLTGELCVGTNRHRLDSTSSTSSKSDNRLPAKEEHQHRRKENTDRGEFRIDQQSTRKSSSVTFQRRIDQIRFVTIEDLSVGKTREKDDAEHSSLSVLQRTSLSMLSVDRRRKPTIERG